MGFITHFESAICREYEIGLFSPSHGGLEPGGLTLGIFSLSHAYYYYCYYGFILCRKVIKLHLLTITLGLNQRRQILGLVKIQTNFRFIFRHMLEIIFFFKNIKIRSVCQPRMHGS